MYNLPGDIESKVGDIVKFLPNVPHPYGVFSSRKEHLEATYEIVASCFDDPKRQSGYFVWVRQVGKRDRIRWYFHPSEFEYAPVNTFFD